MRDKRIIRSINFPYGMYDWLRQLSARDKSTTRRQIRAAVQNHLKEVTHLLEEAGFSAVTKEDDRHMVRASIDVDIDDEVDAAANRLGVDYAALVLACLRREHGLRYGDAGRQRLLRKIKARQRNEKAVDEVDDHE